MKNVWTEIHWRGLAVAIIAVGAVAAARAGGEDAHCTPSLTRARTSLRDAPSVMPGVDLAKAARSGNIEQTRAGCAARSPKDWNREAQRTLASTITMTTTNVIDRNPAHAITIASAAQ